MIITSPNELYTQLEQAYDSGDPKLVEKLLLDQLYYSTPRCPSCFDPMEITLCNELGSFYRGQGAFSKAETVLERARKRAADHIGMDTSEYATILTNLATCYRLSGKLDMAVSLFEQSSEIYKSCGEDCEELYYEMLNNLSLVYMDKKEYKKAKTLLTTVSAYCAAHPEYRRELAIALNNLGSLALMTGQTDEAAEYLDQCISIYDKLDISDQAHLAAVYNSLGQLYFQKKELNKAQTCYEKAKELTIYHFGKNHEYDQLCENIVLVEQYQQMKGGQ